MAKRRESAGANVRVGGLGDRRREDRALMVLRLNDVTLA